ncbi:hypothetical protein DXG01_005920 [Tephrocybe rancida]|nr:hypothetical protein DXG01_005920 [Tephrocybe rancida]
MKRTGVELCRKWFTVDLLTQQGLDEQTVATSVTHLLENKRYLNIGLDQKDPNHMVDGDTEYMTHPGIQDFISTFYYKNSTGLANFFPEDFSGSVPEPAIILLLTCLHNCLEELTTGKRVQKPFKGGVYRQIYREIGEKFEDLKRDSSQAVKFSEQRTAWAKLGIVKTGDMTTAEQNLKTALFNWRKTTATAQLGPLAVRQYGAKPFISDQIVDRLVLCARAHKLPTVSCISKEAEWRKDWATTHGTSLLSLVLSHFPPPTTTQSPAQPTDATPATGDTVPKKRTMGCSRCKEAGVEFTGHITFYLTQLKNLTEIVLPSRKNARKLNSHNLAPTCKRALDTMSSPTHDHTLIKQRRKCGASAIHPNVYTSHHGPAHIGYLGPKLLSTPSRAISSRAISDLTSLPIHTPSRWPFVTDSLVPTPLSLNIKISIVFNLCFIS